MISVDSSVDCGWLERMRFIDFDGGNENVNISEEFYANGVNQLTLIPMSGRSFVRI